MAHISESLDLNSEAPLIEDEHENPRVNKHASQIVDIERETSSIDESRGKGLGLSLSLSIPNESSRDPSVEVRESGLSLSVSPSNENNSTPDEVREAGNDGCQNNGEEEEKEVMRKEEESVTPRTRPRKNTAIKDKEHVNMELPQGERGFCAGDLVWGKVKSHPWWPGQIFDPSSSSERARRYEKKDHHLVCYFGDQTFAWCNEFQLRPFRSNFEQMENQNSMDAFLDAIDDALEEVSRRVQLGLTCSCLPEEACNTLKSKKVLNAGLRQEVTYPDENVRSFPISSFETEGFLDYIRKLAVSPFLGGNKLEFFNFQAQFSAFLRAKGISKLAEFKDNEKILGHDDESWFIDEIEGTDRNSALIKEKGQVLQELEGSKVEETERLNSSQFQRHSPEDGLYANRKQRSMDELLAEKREKSVSSRELKRKRRKTGTKSPKLMAGKSETVGGSRSGNFTITGEKGIARKSGNQKPLKVGKHISSRSIAEIMARKRKAISNQNGVKTERDITYKRRTRELASGPTAEKSNSTGFLSPEPMQKTKKRSASFRESRSEASHSVKKRKPEVSLSSGSKKNRRLSSSSAEVIETLHSAEKHTKAGSSHSLESRQEIEILPMAKKQRASGSSLSPYSKQTRKSVSQKEKRTRKSVSQKEANMKAPTSFKVGDCISRIASRLTGSPPTVKEDGVSPLMTTVSGKRGRGRPRKTKMEEERSANGQKEKLATSVRVSPENTTDGVKRRGRPRSVKNEEQKVRVSPENITDGVKRRGRPRSVKNEEQKLIVSPENTTDGVKRIGRFRSRANEEKKVRVSPENTTDGVKRRGRPRSVENKEQKLMVSPENTIDGVKRRGRPRSVENQEQKLRVSPENTTDGVKSRGRPRRVKNEDQKVTQVLKDNRTKNEIVLTKETTGSEKRRGRGRPPKEKREDEEGTPIMKDHPTRNEIVLYKTTGGEKRGRGRPPKARKEVEKGTPLVKKNCTTNEMLEQLVAAARDPDVQEDSAVIGFFSAFRSSLCPEAFNPEQTEEIQESERDNSIDIRNTSKPERENVEVGHNREPNPGVQPQEKKLESVVIPIVSSPDDSGSGNGAKENEEKGKDVDGSECSEREVEEESSPTALILSFTQGDNALPSEAELNQIFGKFGPLKESETEVLQKSCRSRVVFKRRADAEAAFSSAGKFSIFGPALVSYRLKYSSLSK
ncbi:transcriptional regulator ATRX isoform X1 [Amborella trichopoda]|uniref:PWWP domain-containing protein n=1 Tax=Amborella trichopoda TaxID=13333 RepID=W1PAF9_AMBTC|nr:transcriptional regulator ATRX isoform X1 [Amborella trichopoda]ERN04923.1 hypothetical protein AMTR_s00080p00099010 [Amborella trichopoda]|eukprot:XP_006843248.1 transcriptional regulator ATRX isoform X1 [Amborella trichopoda]